ncbi:hypothetical protein BH10BAC1_BH10BAC1_00070 [soil metagenome]
MKKINTFLSRIKRFDKLIFIIILVVIAFQYEYQKTTYFVPQSTHYWRQADCASFAMMYFDHGMNFFEPKVFNVLMGEGNAAGEFPIIYYFVACLYKLFGPHEFIFRIVILLSFTFGMLSLYNICKRVIQDRFFAFVIPILLFSSPLIMLYANNFLCDIPSLSFSFIAWDMILRYREKKRIKHFWFSMLFFALASLLKLNAAISFVALGAIFFIELNGWQKIKEEKLFVHLKSNILGFGFALLAIFIWYWWAIDYNEKYSVSFLGTKTWPGWPIWDTSDEGFVRAVNGFFGESVYIFFQPTYALVIFLLFFVHLNRDKLDAFLYNVYLLTLIGVALFVCTFFLGIRDNIYYCINLMILPIFIFICSCQILKNKYPVTWNSIVFRAILFVFLLLNVNYSKGTLDKLYHHGIEHFRLTDESFSQSKFRAFIDSIGIQKTDKVISFPDGTPDASLYILGRQGWSEYNLKRDDTVGINNCIKSGAKYLIINNSFVLAEPAIENYSGDFVANYDNFYVYKLGVGQKNTKNRKGLIACKNKLYLSVGDLNANRVVSGSDSINGSTFHLIYIGNNNVAIKASNGDLLSCDMNNEGKIIVNNSWLGAWEIFKQTVHPDGTFTLKAFNGKFVSFDEKEKNVLKASADSIGVNQNFYYN